MNSKNAPDGLQEEQIHPFKIMSCIYHSIWLIHKVMYHIHANAEVVNFHLLGLCSVKPVLVTKPLGIQIHHCIPTDALCIIVEQLQESHYYRFQTLLDPFKY